MSGLVGYASNSSDEDDSNVVSGLSSLQADTQSEQKESEKQLSFDESKIRIATTYTENCPGVATTEGEHVTNGIMKVPSMNEGLVGPMGPPIHVSNGDIVFVPHSPYSRSRSLVHDLTLPPIANLDIPPSPPGSSSPEIDKRLEHFLDLKSQGIHFNEKLARSSALKNPSLLEKLMRFAGMEEKDQYASTLSTEYWNPNEFPPWAYKDELSRSQTNISKQIEEDKKRLQRDSIEFVPSTVPEESNATCASDSNVGSKASRGSAAERVMAGLDREKPRSPLVDLKSSRGGLPRRGVRSEASNRTIS